MIKGRLGEKSYKPKFSGHETFPFRYLWLSKLLISIEEKGSAYLKEYSMLDQMVSPRVEILYKNGFLTLRPVSTNDKFEI